MIYEMKYHQFANSEYFKDHCDFQRVNTRKCTFEVFMYFETQFF